MVVYVDDMKAPFGRMIMCHMIADTPKELLDMADLLGVKRRHIQNAGSYDEHFDIALGARARAVKYGAKEITWRELGAMICERRTAAILKATEEQVCAKVLRELKESKL